MTPREVEELAKEIDEKISKNNLILNDEDSLNRTRIDAIENVLFGSRLRLFLVVVYMIINPKWVRDLIQEWQDYEIGD